MNDLLKANKLGINIALFGLILAVGSTIAYLERVIPTDIGMGFTVVGLFVAIVVAPVLNYLKNRTNK